MVINNLHGPIKEAMVLGDCQTFPQLFERATRMQRSIKDGSITFLRNSSNGGEGKPKNTLRTQQPTQEVTISPNKINAVQAQQNAQRQQSTRNQQAIQGGFLQTPNPLKTLLPNRNRKTQRKLRPNPLITCAPGPSAATRCSQATLGTQWSSLPEITPTHSYLFSTLLTWKAISLPREKPLSWPRLFKVMSISPAISSKSFILCVMSSMT